jgi:two-component system chemotaxis response regulator CheB
MIVDDSLVIRRAITGWLDGLGDIAVVGAHANGRLAVEDVARSRPDLVILDIEMPEMDGLTALPLLLARHPGVTVLIASTLSRRGAEVSLKALTLGAADYLTKPEPGGLVSAEQFRLDLVDKIRQLGRRQTRRWQGGASTGPRKPAAPAEPAADAAAPEARRQQRLRPFSMGAVKCLVIGSSTGGPQALARVLTDIGAPLSNVPVLITQHMPPTFTAILAEHLGRATGLPTAEALDGEPIRRGRIYVAPGGRHLIVGKAADGVVARLSDAPPENFCKPAVDPLFRTVADAFGSGVLAVVLTGMGTDGAKGALTVANAGGSVIAQDEATSVVWGMPGATVAAGAASGVLPVGEIGRRVARLLTGARS